MRLGILALAALVSSPALAASFAGTLEMRVSSSGGGPSGNIKIIAGEGGTLTDMSMTTPQGPMKMKTLTKASKPNVIWIINDSNRTVTEVSTSSTGPASMGRGTDDEAWTVKRLGTETIAGYPTVHVRAIGARSGTELELWTSRAVMSAEQYRTALGQESPVTSNMLTALKKEDADGFPVKLVSVQRDGSRMTFELVKATAGAPPASTFAIPAGYTPTAVPAMPEMPPEAARMLEEQMKQMTPEQQEMMRKMMQGK